MKVTIIIPVYNGAKYLAESIESCINQTYSNLEIILIDDCSQDNSKQIIESYAKNYINIKFLYNDNNLGLLRTVNRALKESSGKLVLLLGQDDILQPKHIEIMSKNITTKTAFSYCKSDIINENGEVTKIHNNEKVGKVDLYKLAKHNCINSCGLLMNMEMLRKVGGFTENNEFPNYGEWDLWIKLASLGDIVFESEIASLYRKHQTNISNTFVQPETLRRLNRYYKECRAKALELGKFSLLKKSVLYMHYLRYDLTYWVKSIRK